jgi:outer membrane protein OmpA-like peptidoglycan-associated protein
MSMRTMIIGAALATAVAIPLGAQERGSMEFGAFVSLNSFQDKFNMDNAVGFGGRIGAFLDPRWALEFEGNGGTASRPGGLADRTFRFLDARVLFVPVKVGRAQLLIGAGAGHVDANVNNDFTDQSYGYHALLGGKLAIGENAALRLDGVQYFNDGASHRSFRAGLSLYRHPSGKETTVYRTTSAPPPAQRADSVSAAETRRLRLAAAEYAALRDSLARNRPTAMTPSNVAALATMLEMINFQTDQSDLDDVSRAILRDKVPIFNANPDMKIVITGYASTPGTAAYNMALGMRRATAAKAYLVSQGVAESRVEIATRGANDLLVEGPGEVANAANRRGQFRLLIADPYLVKP